jgi:lipoate-protein ligase A
MKYFDFTFPTPQENLACDEALIDLCERGREGEILRFWEPEGPFVVVGYANHAAREVDLEAAARGGIPVFRRFSGGGTVVQGPGCLNYSLILRIPEGADAISNPLRSITGTNTFILERNRLALEGLIKREVQIRGQTDLAVGDLKFSGNAQRRMKQFLIFHGTFLLNFDISLIEKILPMPSKQPCYRENRSHADFVTNLNIPASQVKSALRKAWNAGEKVTGVPLDEIRELVANKYATEEWNLRF